MNAENATRIAQTWQSNMLPPDLVPLVKFECVLAETHNPFEYTVKMRARLGDAYAEVVLHTEWEGPLAWSVFHELAYRVHDLSKAAAQSALRSHYMPLIRAELPKPLAQKWAKRE